MELMFKDNSVFDMQLTTHWDTSGITDIDKLLVLQPCPVDYTKKQDAGEFEDRCEKKYSGTFDDKDRCKSCPDR